MQAKPKVLVVEDNRINALVAQRFLEKIGLDSEWVQNGQQAFEKVARKHDFDLVFMDLSMPVLDGYEATKKIRELERDQNLPAIPIVALTAHVSASVLEKCILVGMQFHLSKPFSINELKEMLKSSCGYSVGEE